MIVTATKQCVSYVNKLFRPGSWRSQFGKINVRYKRRLYLHTGVGRLAWKVCYQTRCKGCLAQAELMQASPGAPWTSHYFLNSQLREQGNNIRIVLYLCGAGRAISMVSSWWEILLTILWDNCAVTACAGDSVVVSKVLTEGEDGCWHACNSFGGVAVMDATPLVGGSSWSATSPGGMS